MQSMLTWQTFASLLLFWQWDIKSKLVCCSLERVGNVIAEYDFINLWPSAVAPIDTAWDANDQIEDFQVTFEYDLWESSSTS